jgi:hypothetical protein
MVGIICPRVDIGFKGAFKFSNLVGQAVIGWLTEISNSTQPTR